MSAFNPKQRSEIYANATAQVLAFAPITSSELGEVVDNLIFAFSDQLYELYVEATNSLQLLKLDTTTGRDLDLVASEYPDLEPRFQASRATGKVQVTDPTITKISSTVALGGAQDTDTFLNVIDASLFPVSGVVLIGVRGSAVFESRTYTGKIGNQLTGVAPLLFDHGSGEPVVLTTVGDRIFPGPYTLSTEATAQDASKTYETTNVLTIYDGEEFGEVDIESQVAGLDGNTPSNTIVKFIGTPPFSGAVVNNGVPLTNGVAKEKDADLRQRIRQQRQALSTGNIDAVTSALFNADYQGQRVVFAQVIEDPDPTLPSLAYIDDGSGFVPNQETYSQDIILVFSALGGENKFEIPAERRPVVTTDPENATRIFSNINLELNNVALVQGDLPGQYRFHPDRGIIKLMTALNPGDELKITSITYYTGLVQVANWYLYGRRDDRTNYPGVVSLGSWVQIRVPAAQFVTVQGNLTLDGSRPINDVVNEAKQNILSYINNLGIGNTVVRNRIIALAFVPGVKDFTLLLPVGDVIIPDGTLARSTVSNIIIS